MQQLSQWKNPSSSQPKKAHQVKSISNPNRSIPLLLIGLYTRNSLHMDIEFYGDYLRIIREENVYLRSVYEAYSHTKMTKRDVRRKF